MRKIPQIDEVLGSPEQREELLYRIRSRVVDMAMQVMLGGEDNKTKSNSEKLISDMTDSDAADYLGYITAIVSLATWAEFLEMQEEE